MCANKESLGRGGRVVPPSMMMIQRLLGGSSRDSLAEGIEQLALSGEHTKPNDGVKSKGVAAAPKKKVPRYESFEKMGLKEDLMRGIFDYGFLKPSLIQQKAIVPMRDGHDILAQSQSGTGKTGAFVIGTLQRVNTSMIGSTQALILSPTQHLAQQTQKVMKCIGQYMGIKVHLSAGGESLGADMSALRAGAEVVVGTPGRVIDMLKRGCLKASNIKVIVLDEADEMLSTGFRDDMYEVMQYLRQDAQVALFSATIPDELKEVVAELLRDPIQIRVKRDLLTLAGIRQFYVPLETDMDKFDTLCDLHDQLGAGCQTIIFCRSRRGVDQLTQSLNDNDYAVASIHGEMLPRDREKIISKFRKGETRVLISSDLLARGIDVQTVTTVVNYDLPRHMENYLHRVGRCGRFGRKGVAINFVTGRDSEVMDEIEKYYNTKFEKMPREVDLQLLVNTNGK